MHLKSISVHGWLSRIVEMSRFQLHSVCLRVISCFIFFRCESLKSCDTCHGKEVRYKPLLITISQLIDNQPFPAVNQQIRSINPCKSNGRSSEIFGVLLRLARRSTMTHLRPWPPHRHGRSQVLFGIFLTAWDRWGHVQLFKVSVFEVMQEFRLEKYDTYTLNKETN